MIHPPQPYPRPIITTLIQSGLGNQLFQYAAARRLSVAINGHLVLLLANDFTERYARTFSLRHFNIAGHIVLQSQAAAAIQELFPNHEIPNAVTNEKFIFQCIGEHKSDPIFIPDVLTCRTGLQLYGYWQDERYFADIAETIRHDFALKTDLGERNRILRARILSAPSAFIHVRRGDYLTAQHIELFGVCEAEYYQQAIALLRARHGNHLKIYVFSDDAAWVREVGIGGPDAEQIDWNGDAPWCDIDLMRACQHAVLSNSSFGWWGAWLGDWPGRTVIAPRVWFKSVPLWSEIVPARWLRL